MTARHPRRTRRRAAPASSLPRPVRAEGGIEADVPGPGQRRTTGHREHHVTVDYSYVQKDLVTVAAVGVVVIGFIIGVSFAV